MISSERLYLALHYWTAAAVCEALHWLLLLRLLAMALE